MEGRNLYSLNGCQTDNYHRENEFNAIVELGIYITKMPCSFIYLLEEGVPVITSYKGINPEDLSDLILFCQHAVDAHKTSEFKSSDSNDFFSFPWSLAKNTIGYFFSIPLVDSKGLSAGAFCLMNTTCSGLDDEQKDALNILSQQIVQKVSSKRREKELALSERWFRAFVQNSSDTICILDADGIIRYESPSFYNFSGYKEEEVIGRSCLDFIHPDYRERSAEIFRDVVKKNGASYRDEFLFKKANGEWVMIEVSGKNALDDEVVTGVVINCRDVTEREKIEDEIRIKSKILQGITAHMPVIIFRADEKGILTESIGAGLSKIGLNENEVVGKAIKDLYPEMLGEIEKVYKGEPVTIIFKSDDENAPWFFEFYIFPDKERHSGGLIGFGLDISDRKIYEETQERYATMLEKVNKELDRFAYVVSHDLKAPLRAINNLSEWIEDDLGETINENEDVKYNMTLLRKRVNRMEALINGILAYSRAGRSEIIYENVDIGELIAEICGSIEIPETFTLEMPPLPVIAANKIRLEQIFSNLLSNAVNHQDKPEGKITISYGVKNGFHEFVVADNGPGIDAQYHEKIFIIFQTLLSKDKRESTGVGLAIVKKIIEEQGGQVWVDSARGEGSRFCFRLPVKKVNNI